MKKPKKAYTVFGSYTIGDQVGQGGAGVVYEAIDESNEKHAIKFLDNSSTDKRKRFKNEIGFCSQSVSPYIIKLSEYGTLQDQTPFFVMPLYESSLRVMIGTIKPSNALELFDKILNGVDAAHKKNVVHRDLKPENILIRDAGKELVVADFGISRFSAADLQTVVDTKPKAKLANLQYAAPEQRNVGGVVDHRADIFSLGLILNELFTAVVPQGTGYQAISSVSDQHSYLDDFVNKCIQHQPDSRYQSVDEMKRELLARGNEFIQLQKLSVLEKTVIPTSVASDPVVDKPMVIMGVDWDEGILRIKLNHVVDQRWRGVMQGLSGVSFIMGKSPQDFSYTGNTAEIHAEGRQVKKLVDCFKNWLLVANTNYKIMLEKECKERDRLANKALQQKIAKETERANVLGGLKF